MLTRSSTCASKQSYGSQSVHSEKTPSRTIRSTRSSIDNSQAHAEVAASEAFRRAQATHQHTMTTRSNPARKGSHRSSEGSHLAEARLGRRRSTVARDDKRRPPIKRSTTVDAPTTAKTLEQSSASQPKHSGHNSVTTRKPVHRAPSTTASGSPTPRRRLAKSEVRPSTTSHFHDFSYEANASSDILAAAPTVDPAPRASIRETQTDEEIMNLARDRCLQEFGQQKLRERKSYFFGSTQKLRSRQSNIQPRAFVQDHTVPPYNQADDGTGMLSVTLPEYIQPTISDYKTPAKRDFSASIRSRIKRFLRKSSHASTDVPPQHIEARQLHQSITGDNLDAVGSRKDYEQFMEVVAEPPLLSGSTSRHCSNQAMDTSRVTSWTTSTVDGLHSIVGRESSMSTATQRDENAHPLRQRASFFGRNVQNKLRKASRPDLQSPAHSQGLFSALQSLIQGTHKTDATMGQTSSEDLSEQSLPSDPPPQQRRDGASSSFPHRNSLIRTVTPEDMPDDFRAMTPLVEIASPREDLATEQPMRLRDSSLVRPSARQVASRVQRAQSRWQTPLALGTELSADPNRLTSISPTDQSDLPHSVLARSALSPSIYSQQTASRTTTPDMPTGTVITITGREVKSYAISPGKSQRKVTEEHPVQVSSEWRRWLSGEFKASSTGDEARATGTAGKTMTLTDNTPTNSSTSADGTASRSRQGSDTPSADMMAVKPMRKSRPRPSSRQSSYMNDRYPMIDSSRNSSDPSIRSRGRRASQPKEDLKDAVPSGTATERPQPAAASTKEPTDQSAGPDKIIGEPGKSGSVKIPGKPQSMMELRARYKNRLSDDARQLNIRKKSVLSPNSLVTDETLQSISAGPYAAESHATRLLAGSTIPDANLPALSSSEWLAGPASKQRSPGQMTMGMTKKIVAGKSGSPGQRLATGWLEARVQQDREHTLAFV